jgi:ABC-type Fe3+ transport system substrate-binding protein
MNFARRLSGSLLATAFALATTAGGAIAADWDQGAGKDWDSLLAAARKEGQVVVSVCAGGMADSIGRMFKEDTGIEIRFVTGTLPELNAKFNTELQSGRVTTDVRLSGPNLVLSAKQGLLAPVHDHLLLPGVVNDSNWFGGRLGYTDATERYLPMPARYAGGKPLINTNLIDAKSITTWDDLLKPEFKGKIAAMEPSDGGIGSTAAESIVKSKGIDYLIKLYRDQDVTFVTDRRQLLEWVARGVYPIVIGADAAPEIPTFRQAGVNNIAAVSMRDGPGNLNGGCSVMAVPEKAPHPNAAMVFANWFLSKRGQEAYVLGHRQPSNRLDVSNASVPDNLIPEAGVEYFDLYREAYVLTERAALQAAIAKAMGK